MDILRISKMAAESNWTLVINAVGDSDVDQSDTKNNKNIKLGKDDKLVRGEELDHE